ncbi:MAG: alpha/beta hydrolase [Magnetococcus sp. YQC-9]
MSLPLVLVHGWGFGAGMWRPLRRGLTTQTVQVLDLGFYGRPQLEFPPDRNFIAIGHSLGFLWLTRQLQTQPDLSSRCLGLIAVNGFCRFARAEDFPAGVPRRILERMSVRLLSDPEGVLHDFLRQGGIEQPLALPSGVDIPALQQGLVWLTDWDSRALFVDWHKPLQVIASLDDRVVTPEMTRSQFDAMPADCQCWLPDGGHLLPMTRPGFLASQIHAFVDVCVA